MLDDLSFTIDGGRKAALTGRTGSGKSTCILSLFRILEANEGAILIDGIDISKVPLAELRKRALSTVPQDPVLFKGSVRFNLDPFDSYTDHEIWNALRRVHLTSEGRQLSIGIEDKAVGLDYILSEGGRNLSKGQRQLFCFARALLRNTKIICIDEGTSSVDETSDQLIQQTLRESFPENTLIVIAHRLNTVRAVDKILVLDAGKLVEEGAPEELIDRDGGIFAAMWAAQSSATVT